MAAPPNPPLVPPPPPPVLLPETASRSPKVAPPSLLARLPAWLFVALLALVIRGVYLMEISRSPLFDLLLGDAFTYDKWATRIAGGEWIGSETFYQAPLYPYFLAVIYKLFGHSILAVRLIQIVLGAAACGMVCQAGRVWFGRRAGLTAGLLLALFPPAIFFDALIQKSALDIFFLCGLLWLLAIAPLRSGRQWLWGIAGITLGCLILTRENALLLVPVVLLWSLVRPRHRVMSHRLIGVTAILIGLACVLLPVATRNKVVGGEFHITTSQFGPNFYIGNNADADGTYVPLRFGRGDAVFERRDAIDIAEEKTGHPLTPGEVSAYWTQRTLDDIRAAPGRWLRLIARKLAMTISALEVGDTEDIYTYARWSLILSAWGAVFHFGTLLPLTALGLVMSWPRWRRTWLVHASLLVMVASVAMFYIFARYRFPMAPMAVLLASAGIASLIDVMARRGSSPALQFTPTIGSGHWIVGASAALIIAVIVNIPILPKAIMLSASLNNLGRAMADRGQYDAAVTYLSESIALVPGYAVAHTNLGGALAQQKRIDEAIKHHQEALRLKPDFAFAHYNLGAALMERREYPAALTHIDAAIRLQPASASALHNRGYCLAMMGRRSEAIEAYRAALKVNPDHGEAHNSLGIALAQEGKLDEAMPHLEAGARLAPQNPDHHFNLGNGQLMKGRFSLAAGSFNAVLRLRPDDRAAVGKLGLALAGMGKDEEAVATLRRAMSTGAARPEMVIRLIWLLAESASPQVRNPVDALALARRAMEVSKGASAEVLEAAGAAEAANGRWEAALERANKAAELYRNAGNHTAARTTQQRAETYSVKIQTRPATSTSQSPASSPAP